MANYNTLLGGTDVGLNSTAQLASAGQASAANMANIDLTGGQQQASQINNAGAARASGIVNSANAWGGAISGVTNDALGVYAQDTAGNIGTSLFHQAGGGAGVNSPNAIPLESAQLPNSIPMPPPVDPLTQSPYFNPYQSSYGR